MQAYTHKTKHSDFDFSYRKFILMRMMVLGYLGKTVCPKELNSNVN